MTSLVVRSHNLIDLPAVRRWELEHLHMECTGPLSAFHLLKNSNIYIGQDRQNFERKIVIISLYIIGP